MYGSRGRSRASAWILGAMVLLGSCVLVALAAFRVAGAAAGVGVTAVLVGAVASTGVVRWWVQSRAAAAAVTRRRRRVLLVGDGPVAEHLARLAGEEGWDVLSFVEYLESASAGLWASRSALPDLARDLGVDRVLVADGPAITWELVEQIDREDAPVEVCVVPSAYELALGRPSNMRIGDVALLRLSRGRGRRAYRVAKRIFDVAASAALLLLLAPVLLLAMVAIRLASPGPSVFRQVRIGKDGRPFQILKLRTMVMDAEKDGPRLCEGRQDPRLTPVGRFLRKTHLDEVPQLWNVLKGEMSLVGPRPERPCFVEQFERELPRYSERHRILPGITGLAQVNGFYHSGPREKLRFDLMYLYHQSFWLDLHILFRTLLGVFK